MPSSKAVGDSAEKEAVKVLESQGYYVCRTWRQYAFNPATRKAFSMQADFFGCHDLVAIPRPDNPDPRIRWVQVTAEDYAWAKKEKDIREAFPDGWPETTTVKEIWVSRKKKMEKGMTRKDFLKWKRFDTRIVLPAGGLTDIRQVPYA